MTADYRRKDRNREKPATFVGLIRSGPRVIWDCGEKHASAVDALLCAREEIAKRKTARKLIAF